MRKNITVNLTAEENEKLDQLVEFFQVQSISNVSRSDIFKFLLNKIYNIVEESDEKELTRIFEQRFDLNINFNASFDNEFMFESMVADNELMDKV